MVTVGTLCVGTSGLFGTTNAWLLWERFVCLVLSSRGYCWCMPCPFGALNGGYCWCMSCPSGAPNGGYCWCMSCALNGGYCGSVTSSLAKCGYIKSL